ncbi:MAG: hypothetical protein IKL44_05065 [Clostridia bacterium]|nr:hypothetical protein [Clostridia bacterium]
MDTLLSLFISCVTPENYRAEYFIGLFTSSEEIDVVVKKLISSNGKFSEPNCNVRIEEVEVVGESDSVECVYRFYGQNIDSSVGGDIIESPCYVEKSTAIQELMKAKMDNPRQQWRLETHVIGKCNY